MMDENELRQWLKEHPGESPPGMPDGAIGVIFSQEPKRPGKDFGLLRTLFRPCAHTFADTIRWMLEKVDAEEVPFETLSRGRKWSLDFNFKEWARQAGRPADTRPRYTVYRLPPTDRNRLYLEGGKPDFLIVEWETESFETDSNRLFLEGKLYQGVSAADIDGDTEQFRTFISCLYHYLEEF